MADVVADGVHLAVEFAAKHAIAQVDERRSRILLHDAARPLQVGKDSNARPRIKVFVAAAREVEILRVRLPVTIRILIERLRTRAQHALYILRQGAAFRFNTTRGLHKSHGIPKLKRPGLIGVTPAHGTVDLNYTIGNLRHHGRGVNDVVTEQLPDEPAGFIIQRHDCFQTV